MKKALMACLLAALFCAAPSMGRAEYYKYRDAKGVVRFTDNLAEVPLDQREDAKRYEEFVTPAGEQKPIVTPAAKTHENGKGQSSGKSNTAASVTQLNSRRDNLDYQYRRLLDEKLSLEKERVKVKTRREVESYNRKAQALNKKIAAYEKRRAAFEQHVEALNAN